MDMEQTIKSTDEINESHSDIDVSVYMLTYYHEKYVAQAIESVLSQKTHYKYELVISDDCSGDRTQEIIKEYQSRYPDKIRININEENIGIPSNIYKARTMCRGRYITNLSGDDYWINDDKLEKETAFLEKHPEYSAVACRIELRMNDEKTAYASVPSDIRMVNRAFELKDYEKCLPLGTHGLFMKNYFLTKEGREYFGMAGEISRYVDDAVDEVLLLLKGPIYVLDIVSDVHRVVEVSGDRNNYNSRYTRLEKFTHHIDLLNTMYEKWGDRIDFSGWYANYLATGILSMLVSRDFKGYRSVIRTIPGSFKRPFYKSVYIRWIPYAVRTVAGRISRHV